MQNPEFSPRHLRINRMNQKFYNITPATVVPESTSTAVQADSAVEVEQAVLDVDGLVDWLDRIWSDGQIEGWTQDQYLEFRDAIESAGQ
jgi:hypothetical protein